MLLVVDLAYVLHLVRQQRSYCLSAWALQQEPWKGPKGSPLVGGVFQTFLEVHGAVRNGVPEKTIIATTSTSTYNSASLPALGHPTCSRFRSLRASFSANAESVWLVAIACRLRGNRAALRFWEASLLWFCKAAVKTSLLALVPFEFRFEFGLRSGFRVT